MKKDLREILRENYILNEKVIKMQSELNFMKILLVLSLIVLFVDVLIRLWS